MKTCKSYERDGKELNSRTASREGNLEGLLRKHEGQAQHLAWKLAKNSEEAKELVQEASYRALRCWHGCDPLKSFGTWYLTIVRNLFVDRRRAGKRTVSLSEPIEGREGEGLLEVLADGETGILERMEREELAQAAREAVTALAEKYRAVVRLCDMDGMEPKDAARKLRIPVGTVRSRLCRGRAALRRDPAIIRLA